MRKQKKKNNKAEEKTHIKLIIIFSIIALAVLSAFIFMESQGSISVEFTTQVIGRDNNTRKENYLIAGREALLTFRLTDNKTGKQVSGLEPDISFYSMQTGEGVAEHRHFSDNHTTGEISFAKLQLFVLNSQRSTIEVLDAFGDYDPRPLPIKRLGTMTSKVIRLKGAPDHKAGDIVAGRYGDNVFVTLPSEDQVASVNTQTHEVVNYINVERSPGRMFIQPESRYLWVSNDNSSSMSIINTDNNTLTKTIRTGRGYHQIAFSPQKAYVTNSENGTVSVIRLDDLEKEKDIDVGKAPYGIASSKVRSEIFVSDILQGTVSVIDTGTDKITGNIPLTRGIEAVSFSPDGTVGIVLNPHSGIAYVIDAVNRKIIRSVRTGEAPSDIVFMEEYAMIRNSYSPDITFISMKDPGVSNIALVGVEPALTRMPHSILTTSSGDETVVTSPREGKIYFMHIMNGEPMSMSSTRVEFGSDAVAIVENRLHETEPGIYQQYIILDREGTYDIKFKSERINATFRIEVMPDLTIGFQTTALFNETLQTGKTSILQYRIIERRTGMPEENLTDLIYTLIRPAGNKGVWTERLYARHIGNGTYEARIKFSEEGEYTVGITSDTLRSRGYETRYDYIRVRNTTQ